MSDLQDPGHEDVRSLLQTIGPAMVVLGGIFTVVGLGSFFSAFSSPADFGPPRYFWCAFVGLPLVAVGMGISKFAYMGSIFRYIANETAPVAKDTTNYMVEGTKDSIRDVATAIGEGLHGAQSAHSSHCQKCGTDNESSANFCRECGAPFAKTKRCTQCGDSNRADARFCDHCGAAIA